MPTTTVRPNGSQRPAPGNTPLIHHDTPGDHRKGDAVKKPILIGLAGLIVVAGVVLALVLSGVGQHEDGAPKSGVIHPTLTELWDGQLGELTGPTACSDMSCAGQTVTLIKTRADQVGSDARKRNAGGVVDYAQQVSTATESWTVQCAEVYTDSSPGSGPCLKSLQVLEAGVGILLDEIHKFDSAR